MKKQALKSGEYNLLPFTFTVWFIAEIIFNTTLSNILPLDLDRIASLIDYTVFFLLMMQIVFFQEYSSKEIMAVVLITLPIALSTLLSGSVRVMGTWMFIVACKYTDLDEIVLVAYRVLRITLPAVVFLCLIGLLPDASSYRFEVLRHSMGFNHPNYLGMKIFQLSAFYVYLYWERLKKGVMIGAVLTIAFLYFVPNSITSVLCTAMLFLLTALGQILEKKESSLLELLKTVLLIATFLCIVASVLISIYGVDLPVLQKLDGWMSYRLSLAHKVYKIYGISLFGQKVSLDYLLDSGYMDLLLRFGFFVFLIFLIAYISNMAYHKKDTALYFLLCVFAFHGIMEYGVYLVARNVFILLFSEIIYIKPKRRRY